MNTLARREKDLTRTVGKALSSAVVLAMGMAFFNTVGVYRASAQSWNKTTAKNGSYASVACSADGSRLLAPSTQFYTSSSNYGNDWVTSNVPTLHYVACSADGNRIAAFANSGGIYISTNAGSSWTQTTAPNVIYWQLTSSADGAILAAVTAVSPLNSNLVYVSTDFGGTWNATVPEAPWRWVACSADGTKLFASTIGWGLSGAGPIYRSSNSGASWTATSAPLGVWDCVACSSDGTQLYASRNVIQGSRIYSSTDSGTTWVTNDVPQFAWSCLACSADGSRVVAVPKVTANTPAGGPIYFSTNSGASWVQADAPATNWFAVACSADGCFAVAAVNGGGIYTSRVTPAPKLWIGAQVDQVQLSWVIPSMNFTLQENSDLSTANWTDVTNVPTMIGIEAQVLAPRSGASRAYRLRSTSQ